MSGPETKKDRPFYKDVAVAQGMMALLFFLLVPLVNIFGPGYQRTASMLHGLGAALTMLLSTYAMHAYYGYAKGNAAAKTKLQNRLLLTNVLTLCTIVAANWLYADYQAPDGASEWLKLHAPAGHWVLMEYKEFVALMAFPFGTAASVLLWRMPETSGGEAEVFRYIIGMLLTLLWFCLLVGFAFGLMLAKWKMV
ncbi:hypothetical protein ACFQI7_10900 [Paenibacillus allorhizosphaerae]|uniref:Uncharacterized protein n=1 Tax=Paenibacillus allorhizosphaerae TaxID=2849866 RepID=A0ABN7TN88_9BACL|nr:hypothetical protein [Paenibacillus allorhizosphaerae]CAG7642817.1 hypothetical protein PAECIP111802_02907 [Paenibacillus allorhizosphaerae]